jgi:tetratricopeptide (TPR) repeat protein
LLLTIVGIGLLSSPLLAFYLNQQRKLAKQGQNQATKSAAELKHVSDFMQSVWHSADPYINGKDLLASELLDDAVLQANDKFQDNPRVLADVSLALGANYHELGFADKAVDVLEKSVDCYAQADGPESKKTLLANSRLAVALLYASKAEDAKTLIQSTAETWLSRFPLDDDYDEIEDARITILMEVDEYSNAIELRRESIERIAVRDGEDSKNVRSQQLQLALALIEKEEFKEAEVLVSKVIQLCDQDQATQESLYADALGLMGRVRREQENYEKAIEYHQQALDIQVELLGEDHWESLRRMESLSLSMIGAKKHDDAIQMLRRRADAASSRYGKSHRESVTAEIKILRFEGDPLKRIDGFESLLPRMLEAFPADHSQVLAAKQNAAQAYTYAGNPVEAAKILREIAPVVANVYGPFHRNTLRTQLVLADAICNAESAEAAVTFLESVYDGHLQELGPKHPSSVDLLCNMANYAFRGRLLDRAERWADKAIASCDHLDQPQLAFRRADMLLVLAESKLAKKEYDSAIENAMASHSIFSRPGRPNVFLAHAEALSSVAHLKSGNVDKTRKSVENAEAILKSLPEIHSEAWRRARAKELLSHCSAPLPEKNSQEIQNP